MKNKIKFIFSLFIIAFLGLSTCHNSIMETWWDTSSSEQEEVTTVYYEVDFQAHLGSPVPGIQYIAHNQKIMKVQPISRSGFAFAGWFTQQTGGREWDFANDRVTSNLVLHARWESDVSTNIYTVNFQSNGGNLGGREYLLNSQRVVHGSRVIEPPAMKKQAASTDVWYGFGGWFTTPGFTAGSEWNFAADRVSGDMTLYAKWEDPPRCFVTFFPLGGSPEPRSQDLLEGTKIVEPLAMLHTGYGFGGWYSDPNFTEGSQWDFNTRVGTQDIALYARWITNEYVVTFNANGGSPAPISQKVNHGTLLPSPLLMKKTGEAFLGWFTNDGNEWNFDSDKVTSDLNLSARWGEAHYVVRFDLKLPDGSISDNTGGHGLPPPPVQELSLGRKIFEPVPGNILNWSFFGWFYSDIDNFDPEIEGHRNALKPWDFDWDIYLDNNDDLAVSNNGLEEKLKTKIEADNVIFTLYARWVPNVPDMVWVRKGSFMMGAAGSGTSPVRNVKFESGFYISKYQVTQAEYRNVMITSFPDVRINDPSSFKGEPRQMSRPVERVSWFDAVLFCNEKTAKEAGLLEVYNISSIIRDPQTTINPITGADVTADFSRNGYRLPTEAEWEYAARGGNGSPGNFIYAGSSIAEDFAWFNTNSGGQTHPVGTKLSNGLGIYDMSGNVMEWCWDWYGSAYYTGRPVPDIDPKGPVSGTERVRRGGAWGNAINNLRNTARASFIPENATYVMGIRVVRNVGPTEVY
ncbi:MAG: SUMF1/EgtB/PvdO family nonheme iron enzyme [Treponema sp.]|jgi:uncharacterized repeat protein (TIGR02543 family)|nr:SUMF1/EgtB/PvdO family nonheme iron enzyme [Treponema sp.]